MVDFRFSRVADDGIFRIKLHLGVFLQIQLHPLGHRIGALHNKQGFGNILGPFEVGVKIHIQKAVIELVVECPVGQHQLQIRELLINIAGALLNLHIMKIQQLGFQPSASHPVDQCSDDEAGNTGNQ
ncbi:hypothetical protein D3C76_1429830 [compost metagenome]